MKFPISQSLSFATTVTLLGSGGGKLVDKKKQHCKRLLQPALLIHLPECISYLGSVSAAIK